MQIIDGQIKIIKDSRGNNTLEAHLLAKEGDGKNVVALASVPAGKSTGAHEAFVLDPKKAFDKFSEIKNNFLKINFRDQREFDSLLIALDGTQNKSNLGANLILSLSLAFARAWSKSRGIELYRYLKDLSDNQKKLFEDFPRPLFNVVNGGAHVEIPQSWDKKFGIKKGLDLQEFQVIPTVKDFGIGLSVGQEFYKKLGKELSKIYGKENVLLGDEAGYVCPFKTNEEALEIMQELINRHLYPLKIGLDAAASQFYSKENDLYTIEKSQMTPEEISVFYSDLFDRYELISLEDPFDEESFDDFHRLSDELLIQKTSNQSKKLIITDDLTTTNPQRLKEAIEKKSGNAILIKLNQIGTLSETIDVIKMARENNWQQVVSHRSGETMDSFIADLAAGSGAWGLKSGAPGKPERMAKYSRMLEIWKKENVVF